MSPSARARSVDLSAFNPEYTVRSQFVAFLQKQPWRESARILDFGAGNSPYRPYFQCDRYQTADVTYDVEFRPDFPIDPESPRIDAPDDSRARSSRCAFTITWIIKRSRRRWASHSAT